MLRKGVESGGWSIPDHVKDNRIYSINMLHLYKEKFAKQRQNIGAIPGKNPDFEFASSSKITSFGNSI